jgi:hypothetical protein
LDLSGEEICKNAFEPWFTAGGWKVEDFTAPKTAEFQIPEIVGSLKNQDDKEYLEKALLEYVKAINFPYDGVAKRGKFEICFDYKFKHTIKNGLGIRKKDYDKYFSWKKPWFYLLIYVDDIKQRFIHQIQNPKDFEIKYYGCIQHYVLPSETYWETAQPDFRVELPTFDENMSIKESIALTIAFEECAYDNFTGKFQGVTKNELIRAERILESRNPMFNIRLRKSHFIFDKILKET